MIKTSQLIFALVIIVICIIIYFNYKPNISQFTDITNQQQLAINLPSTDVNFIIDPDITNIENPVSNFKLKQLDNTFIYINIFQHKTIKIQPFTYRPLAQYCSISQKPVSLDEIIKILKNTKGLHIITSAQIIPKNYKQVWQSGNLEQDDKSNKQISIWHPTPQKDSATMGDIIMMGNNPPSDDIIPCIGINIVSPNPESNGILWSATNSQHEKCFCWSATNYNFFRCTNDYNAKLPEFDRVYNLPQDKLDFNTLSA